MAVFTPKRIAGPTQPGTTTTVLYTVPTATKTIVKQIILANTDAAARTVTVAVGSAATAANQIVPTTSIPPNVVVVIDVTLVLDAGETLQALQSLATAITVTVTGVQKV